MYYLIFEIMNILLNYFIQQKLVNSVLKMTMIQLTTNFFANKSVQYATASGCCPIDTRTFATSTVCPDRNLISRFSLSWNIIKHKLNRITLKQVHMLEMTTERT